MNGWFVPGHENGKHRQTRGYNYYLVNTQIYSYVEVATQEAKIKHGDQVTRDMILFLNGTITDRKTK